MFQPRFAGLVESGTKRQTIRPLPKRPVRPGHLLSLRVWTERPYGSRQRVLGTAVVTSVEPVTIEDTGREDLVTVAGRQLPPEELHAFAVADGFAGALEMFNWFEQTHGLPFTGVLIKWGELSIHNS